MPQFQYVGVDKEGKKAQGVIESQDENQLRMVLRGMGVRPMRIVRASALNADLGSALKAAGRGGGVRAASVALFTRQLQVLISSGVPLVQSLEILAEQMDDKALRNVTLAIKEKVSSGSYLWEALGGYPAVFSNLYVSLCRAGEASGSLDQMLKRLTRYLEDSERLKRILKSAMMYPAIVIVIGISVVALMMVFVIPKFEELLTGSGQELPAPTRIVISISHFLADNALYLIAGIAAGGYLGYKYFRSREGKALLDRAFFRVPIFGPLMQKGGTARFARTMSTLLSSGVNLIDAIDICRTTIDNAVLEEAVATIRADVESGKTLGMVVSRLTVFPKMATQMISVGENTGALDRMLEKVADFYEEEVETLVGGMTKLIEPIVLVVLGGTVGGIMIAMYLPIFKMAGGAGG